MFHTFYFVFFFFLAFKVIPTFNKQQHGLNRAISSIEGIALSYAECMGQTI